MGDPISTGLAVAQVGIAAVSGFAQANNAQEQEQQTDAAAKKQTRASYAEIQRQEGEVNRIATEQTSDRIRAADAELGSARVAALERGVSGTTMSAITRQIGYLEGADLSRIESNRTANISAGEASKKSAKNGYLETVAIAANQTSVANTSAFLGTVGSGLSITGNYFQQQSYLNSLTNQKVG